MKNQIRTQLFALALIAQFLSSDTRLAATQETERVIRVPLGTRLSTLILPTDKTVLIETRGGDPPLIPKPPKRVDALKYADRLAREADTIIVVEVVGRSSELTPQEDRIRSRYEAKVIESLKVHPKFNAAIPVNLPQSGGEVRIGECVVKMLPAWEEPYEIGHRYLVRFIGTGFGVHEITADSKLKSLDLVPYPPEYSHPLDGAAAGPVLERIRKAIPKRK